MPIPQFNVFGWLPPGVHDCTVPEIEAVLCRTGRRRALMNGFLACLREEIRPRFHEPIFVDGSFVTTEDEPHDIDIAVDLDNSPADRKWSGQVFTRIHQERLHRDYGVDFWVNLPELGANFLEFFQYTTTDRGEPREKTKYLKGILRLS